MSTVTEISVVAANAELLTFVPQPVSAVLLIFPITEEHEKHRQKEFEEAVHTPIDYSPAIYFLKQTVGNACGSIAHINHWHNFSEQRAEHLKHAMDTATVNDEIGEEGESRVIDRDEHVNLHFVCFVNVNNELYELDGRHPHPIKHTVQKQSGQPLDLLRSTKDVILNLVDNAGGDIRFSMTTLTKTA